MSRSLKEWAEEIHESNIEAGWWQGSWDKDRLASKIALIHSETSEMLEGLHKGLPDEKLPYRSNEEVEWADLFIRMMDYAGARGFDCDNAVADKRDYNRHRADHKPENREKDGGKSF